MNHSVNPCRRVASYDGRPARRRGSVYHILNLVALLAVLSSAALRLIKSGGPSGTFHVTWPGSQESWMTALHCHSLRVEDHQTPFPPRAMDCFVALTVYFIDSTYLRE